MAEPTVVCPNCKTEIKLTESLAAPLLKATRRDFEQRLRQKDTDLATKLLAIMKDGQFHKEPQTAWQSRRRIA